MTANQKTENHKYCFSTNQRKNQSLVFEHNYDPTSKCIMPSFPVFKYREGGYDCRLAPMLPIDVTSDTGEETERGQKQKTSLKIIMLY